MKFLRDHWEETVTSAASLAIIAGIGAYVAIAEEPGIKTLGKLCILAATILGMLLQIGTSAFARRKRAERLKKAAAVAMLVPGSASGIPFLIGFAIGAGIVGVGGFIAIKVWSRLISLQLRELQRQEEQRKADGQAPDLAMTSPSPLTSPLTSPLAVAVAALPAAPGGSTTVFSPFPGLSLSVGPGQEIEYSSDLIHWTAAPAQTPSGPSGFWRVVPAERSGRAAQ